MEISGLQIDKIHVVLSNQLYTRNSSTVFWT